MLYDNPYMIIFVKNEILEFFEKEICKVVNENDKVYGMNVFSEDKGDSYKLI